MARQKFSLLAISHDCETHLLYSWHTTNEMSLKLVTQAKQNNNKNYFDESKNENNFVIWVLLNHLYRASSLICLQKDLLLHKLNSPNTRLRTQLEWWECCTLMNSLIVRTLQILAINMPTNKDQAIHRPSGTITACIFFPFLLLLLIHSFSLSSGKVRFKLCNTFTKYRYKAPSSIFFNT